MNLRFVFLSILGLVLLLNPVRSYSQAFEPTNAGDGVNTEYAEVNPLLSLTGDTLFFHRIDSPENRYGAEGSQDIYMSVKDEEGNWGPAERLPNEINITRYNSLLSVLPGGRYLISGVFDGFGRRWVRRGFSIVRHQDSLGWSKPEKLHVPWYYTRSRSVQTAASMTPDGQYLFMSFGRREGKVAQQLYVAMAKNDEGTRFTKPKKLEGPMERLVSAEAPFYHAGEDRLYFSGTTSKKSGNSDMYYVELLKDRTGNGLVKPVEDVEATASVDAASSGETSAEGEAPAVGEKKKKKREKLPMPQWTDSLYRLSDTVNTDSWEGYWRPSGDGSYAMFCSDRGGGNGQSDIYHVMLVETRPWVSITGRILDKRTGNLIPRDKNPQVLVNGQPCDSIVLADDRSTFVAQLPLDSLYLFTAVVPYFNSDTFKIDVRGERFHQEMNVDITVETLPYLQVTGRMLDNLSLTPIKPNYQAKVLVDGQVVDSMKIDLEKGTYTVNLPYGKRYKLLLQARTHESREEVLDLTGYNEYGVVTRDLFARPLNANMVTLTGHIINTKTGSPLEPGHVVKMRVNRVESPNFEYKEKGSTYKLLLPAGYDYDLVPSIKNFYNKLEVVDLRKAMARTTVKRDFFVTPLEVGQSVDIENIYFETGKATLKPASFRSLNALVDFFKEYPDVVVEIGGHTDNTGAAALNRRLSKSRAQAVADYMIEQGIPTNRFTVFGYGPDKPKATNKTKKGRAQNRRVDFTIKAVGN